MGSECRICCFILLRLLELSPTEVISVLCLIEWWVIYFVLICDHKGWFLLTWLGLEISESGLFFLTDLLAGMS